MCFPSEVFFTEMGIVNTAPWGPLPQPAARTNLPNAGRGWRRLFTMVVKVAEGEPNYGCYCLSKFGRKLS